MSDGSTKYYSVNPGRDIAMAWRPAPWLVVEVAYTGHVVGFFVDGPHEEEEALAAIVSVGQLAPELLRSVRE